MLRPIPEDESDHAALAASSVETLSAAEAVASDDEEVALRSNVSVASAVLPDDPRDRDIGDIGSSYSGFDKKPSKRRRRRRKHRRRKHRRNRWAPWRSFVVMGIVIAAGVAIVVAILTTTDGTTSATVSETSLPSQSPSASPTIDRETVELLDSLINEIRVPLPNVTVEISAILRGAHDLARQWMLTRDLLRDEVLADPTPVRFTQRYVLALLFFCMQFDNNSNYDMEDAGMAAELTECNWTGVFCDETTVDATETTTIMAFVVRRIEWADFGAVGVLPPELRSLRYLQELNVSCNALQGTVPDLWFENRTSSLSAENMSVEQSYYLPFLYLVDFSHNNLTGLVPPSFWVLPSLRLVYLTNNSFTGSLPSDDFVWQSITSSFLQDIWIDRNQFSGQLPNWIFTLPILRSFIAEDNRFSGSLAGIDDIGTRQVPSDLLDLNMSYNNFTNGLVVLDLSYNYFTGQIPAALFGSDSLAFLYMDHNEFRELPQISYDEKVPLIDVWIQHNELQGRIPDTFGVAWISLEQLRLEGNDLTGEVLPGCENASGEAPVLWPNISRLEADCQRTSMFLEPPVICECCTSCS